MRFIWMPVVLLAIASRALASQTLTVAGNPAALTVTSALAGSQPTPVSASTNYTVTTPNANRTYKITAQLNQAMPAGVTLSATLVAPTGGTSLGAVALDATARDVVTGILKGTNATQTITYQLSALVSAGVVSSSSRTVTLTIVQFP